MSCDFSSPPLPPSVHLLIFIRGSVWQALESLAVKTTHHIKNIIWEGESRRSHGGGSDFDRWRCNCWFKSLYTPRRPQLELNRPHRCVRTSHGSESVNEQSLSEINKTHFDKTSRYWRVWASHTSSHKHVKLFRLPRTSVCVCDDDQRQCGWISVWPLWQISHRHSF